MNVALILSGTGYFIGKPRVAVVQDAVHASNLELLVHW